MLQQNNASLSGTYPLITVCGWVLFSVLCPLERNEGDSDDVIYRSQA